MEAAIIKIVNNRILKIQKVAEKMTYWDDKIRGRWIWVLQFLGMSV